MYIDINIDIESEGMHRKIWKSFSIYRCISPRVIYPKLIQEYVSIISQ